MFRNSLVEPIALIPQPPKWRNPSALPITLITRRVAVAERLHSIRLEE